MVLLGFYIPGMVYKILTKEKITTIRKYNKKWERVFKKFTANPDQEIPLTFYYRQRTPYNIKFLESHITDLEPYLLGDMTEEEAKWDGGTKEQLLTFFKGQYGKNYLKEKFLRIFWDLDFPEDITNPNKTKIDWFEQGKLYTINPLVFNNKNSLNCFYNCCYCYARTFYTRMPDNYVQGFYESRLRGLKKAHDNVFISSTTDLFHDEVPDDLLRYIMEKANEYNENECNLYYLTKNPQKYKNLLQYLDPRINYIGATIETNSYEKQQKITDAPCPSERIKSFQEIDYEKKFISIEPLLEFSNGFTEELIKCKPELVFIGANSNKKVQKALIEPNSNKVFQLIDSLERAGINVIQKGNLSRLLEKPNLARQSLITEFALEEGN